jgi:hypothetical protein
MRNPLIGIAAVTAAFSTAAGEPSSTDPERSRAAFREVARILQSPRCMNCHPDGDAPLQLDNGRIHRMKIRRDIDRLGLRCESCHPTSNLAGAHMPPGAPGWAMPPSRTPMVFQNRTPAQLCQNLKDPATNGNRTLSDLLRHVRDEHLVLWAWSPGEGRTPPAMSHEAFVSKFAEWIDTGAVCPE